MPIFPHGGNIEISGERFVAAWKKWFELYKPALDWRTSCMPRHNRKETLNTLVNNVTAWSVDVLCRVMFSFFQTGLFSMAKLV